MTAVNEVTLIKLLRVEPETSYVIVRCTGWPLKDTLDALEQLRERGLVAYSNWSGDRKYFLTAKALV